MDTTEAAALMGDLVVGEGAERQAVLDEIQRRIDDLRPKPSPVAPPLRSTGGAVSQRNLAAYLRLRREEAYKNA